MTLRYLVEVLGVGERPRRGGIILPGRRGERAYDMVVLLHVRNKDGSPDRRRGAPFEFADARASKNAIHLRWNDRYYGSAGEVVLRKDGRDPPPALKEVLRRLNDISKKRPYGEEEAKGFLEDLRRTVLLHEVMLT